MADQKYPEQNLLQENWSIHKFLWITSFKVGSSRSQRWIPLFSASVVMPVLKWPAAAILHSAVSPGSLGIVSTVGSSTAWGRERTPREIKLMSKVDGNSPILRATRHGTLSRWWSQALEIICKAAPNKHHCKVTAVPFCRQCDSFCGLWKDTCNAPDPPHQRKQSVFFYLWLSPFTCSLKT